MLRPEKRDSEPKKRQGEGKDNNLRNKTLKSIFQISSSVSLMSIRGCISP